MKLYFAPGACSLVVRIIINEIGLDCTYIKVDLRNKKTENGDDFLKINPKGSVPTLELNDGDVLTENAVILQYLADMNNATNLLASPKELKRYRTLEWLNYITTELHKTIGALFNPDLANESKETFVKLIKHKCNFVNNHLSQHQYLVGDAFTLPDDYLFVMIGWLLHFKFDLSEWPNIKRYFDELNKRQSIQKSLMDEKLKSVHAT
jgi:glutathione S-transferase